MAITEHTDLLRSSPDGRRRYVRPPQPVHFPCSEEMPETNRHLELRTALYQILQHELASRATIGSEQFIYYVPTTSKKSLAPDAFVKLGQPHSTFRVWKTWLRGAPDVAVEVVSDSDEGEEDWNAKLERYRDAGIGEVVRFHPDDADSPIRVWDHVDGDLVERERPRIGPFECTSLGLFWVVVSHPMFGRMLRLARDRDGRELLPTPVEAEARARQEAERARQEEARARQEEARARQEAERSREDETRSRQEAERAREDEARARQEAEQTRDKLSAEVAELRRLLEARSGSGATSTARSKPNEKRPPKRAPSAKKARG